jgi:hypothetical protein
MSQKPKDCVHLYSNGACVYCHDPIHVAPVAEPQRKILNNEDIKRIVSSVVPHRCGKDCDCSCGRSYADKWEWVIGPDPRWAKECKCVPRDKEETQPSSYREQTMSDERLSSIYKAAKTNGMGVSFSSEAVISIVERLKNSEAQVLVLTADLQTEKEQHIKCDEAYIAAKKTGLAPVAKPQPSNYREQVTQYIPTFGEFEGYRGMFPGDDDGCGKSYVLYTDYLQQREQVLVQATRIAELEEYATAIQGSIFCHADYEPEEVMEFIRKSTDAILAKKGNQ